jgi:hypothetical protein
MPFKTEAISDAKLNNPVNVAEKKRNPGKKLNPCSSQLTSISNQKDQSPNPPHQSAEKGVPKSPHPHRPE